MPDGIDSNISSYKMEKGGSTPSWSDGAVRHGHGEKARLGEWKELVVIANIIPL